MNSLLPHFAEPHWLWLGLLAMALLFALHRRAAAARRKQLAQVAAPGALAELTRSHSPARRRAKEFLLLTAVALLALTLARPQWGTRDLRGQTFAEDVVFVLDCSRSMLAADVSPDRLERAKLSIRNFARRHGAGRVGLVAFAGGAFLQCPLTFDYAAFEEALASVDPRTIPTGGTDIGLALQEAARALDAKHKTKLIVLLTDGEDLEQRGVKDAAALARTGVKVFTLGVGTPAGTEVRAPGPTGQMELVRDEKGVVVKSRLDEATLKKIAQATGGEYFPLGRLGEGLIKIRAHLEAGGGTTLSGTTSSGGVDRFYVPLTLALILLVAESLLGTRRRAITTVLLALGISFPANLVAATTNAPVTARDHYNAGTKQFAAGKLDTAEASLQTALDRQEESLQPAALYNLGHVRFAQGAAELKKIPGEKTIRADSERALGSGAAAVDTVTAALASDSMPVLVAAYQRGRGAKKELNAAFDVIRRALEAHERTLEKWRLALQDFRGSAELGLPGTNATHNAAVVERTIAELVDRIRQQQMQAMALANKSAQLNALLKQLRGRIPKDQCNGPGEDEPDGDEPGFVMVEQNRIPQEAGGKEGEEKELSLSPEEIGRLLNQYAPPNRRLSMSDQQGKPQPKQPKKSDW